MKRYVLFTVWVVLSILPCCSGSKDPEPVIRPQPGAELCDEVCAHIGPKTVINPDGSVTSHPDALECEEGTPVPVNDGGTIECEPDAGSLECITCTEFCIEQHKDGIYWNTECMLKVTDCAEIETVCNNGGGV